MSVNNIEALNGCEFASQCGLVAEIAKRSNSTMIDCGRKKPDVCARNPNNNQGWIQLTDDSLHSDEDLRAAYPNGLWGTKNL